MASSDQARDPAWLKIVLAVIAIAGPIAVAWISLNPAGVSKQATPSASQQETSSALVAQQLPATTQAPGTSTSQTTETSFASLVQTSTPQPTSTNTPQPTSTSTPQPTSTNTPQATSTATDVAATDVAAADVATDQTAPRVQLSAVDVIGSGTSISQEVGTGLRVVMLDATGRPQKDASVSVYEQILDVSNNPTYGNAVKYGTINQQGRVDFDLPADTYVVCSSTIIRYGWTPNGCVYNVQVNPNALAVVRLQAGGLELGAVNAQGKPLSDVATQVYTQKIDVNGDPSSDQLVASANTNNTGLSRYALTPGKYAVTIDVQGYNWDKPDGKGKMNVEVQPGKTNRIVVRLGALQVKLKKANGTPAANSHVRVYKQTQDVNSSPVLGEAVWSDYTNNGGIVNVDLTPGKYALMIDDRTLYDVNVENGKTTVTDGQTIESPF